MARVGLLRDGVEEAEAEACSWPLLNEYRSGVPAGERGAATGDSSAF
jgi:hypothetical protein